MDDPRRPRDCRMIGERGVRELQTQIELWVLQPDDQRFGLGLDFDPGGGKPRERGFPGNDLVVLESKIQDSRAILGLKDLQRRRPEIAIAVNRIFQRDRIETEFPPQAVGIRAEGAITKLQGKIQRTNLHPGAPIQMR